MLRAVIDQTRLTNATLCGIDKPFCYPITQPSDIVVFLRPEMNQITNMSVKVYDINGNLVQDIPFPDTDYYFAYAQAYDSNGDMYFIMRQTAPFTVNCYSMEIILGDGEETIVTYYTDTVCMVNSYTVRKWDLQTATSNVNDITVTLECDGGDPVNLTYNILPIGFWFDITGGTLYFYTPVGCDITAVDLGGNPLPLPSYEEVTIGLESCLVYDGA